MGKSKKKKKLKNIQGSATLRLISALDVNELVFGCLLGINSKVKKKRKMLDYHAKALRSFFQQIASGE